MADPIVVAPGVIVPEAALEVRAVRASGPGGQNVNKVSSKVELRVDLGQVSGLSPGAWQRLRAATATRRDADDRLMITSQLTRDQGRNLEDAREKVRALIAAALVEPKKRRPTKPSRGSVERRLSEKQRTARTKALRRGGGED
ncbi:MAG: aminoacyl-tRNA hydrolase [Deltaproteobacteria bacterium]|nr:aminoacyl-tRNA hydrolase [Deltaproteobacteria bacterium]